MTDGRRQLEQTLADVANGVGHSGSITGSERMIAALAYEALVDQDQPPKAVRQNIIMPGLARIGGGGPKP